MPTIPYTIALTGGIASGKSRIGHWLKEQGYPVIDADQVAKEICQLGTPASYKIQQAFGAQAYLKNGALNRDFLRKKIFSDPKARQTLEAITHPAIHQHIKTQLQTLKAPLAFVELPLLAETGKPDYIDEVWVADCSEKTQLTRCMERGLDQQTCLNILHSQANRTQRLHYADQLISTEIQWDETENHLKQVLQKYNKHQ